MMNPQPMLFAQYWKAEVDLRRERAGAGSAAPVLGPRWARRTRRWARRATVA